MEGASFLRFVKFVNLLGLASVILAFVAEGFAAYAGYGAKDLSIQECKNLRNPANMLAYAAAITHLASKIFSFVISGAAIAHMVSSSPSFSCQIVMCIPFYLISWGISLMAYFLLLLKAVERNDYTLDLSPDGGDPIIYCLGPKVFYFAGSGILFFVALRFDLFAVSFVVANVIANEDQLPLIY